MLFSSGLLVSFAGALVAAAVAPRGAPSPLIDDEIIYLPPRMANGSIQYNIIYPRGAELSDGTLLATAAYSGGPGLPYFPVFASADGGMTWTYRSNITDQVNGFGLSAQPFLYELPKAIGDYPAGTVLAAGNSEARTGEYGIGQGATRIDLYASPDKGTSWTFVSHVAMGTAPNTTNGAHPIWEPSLLYYGGQLICFYSDQRDYSHGQKLAHQTSNDLLIWSAVVNDVAYGNYTDRPGMTIVAEIPGNLWMIVHEFPGGQMFYDGSGQYPAYYRIASDPRDFLSSEGWAIFANGTQPSSSPYVVWSPSGGPLGSIIVSDADHSQVYVNLAGGDPNSWGICNTPQPKAYSRYLHIPKDNQNHLQIISAGNFPGVDPPNTQTNLSISVVDIDQMLAQNCMFGYGACFSTDCIEKNKATAVPL